MRILKCFLLMLSVCASRSGTSNDSKPDTGFQPSHRTPVEQHGQLHVSGNKIVDQAGNPVQLRGMSFFWSQWIGKYYTKETVQWLKDDWRCSVVRVAMAVDNGGYVANPEAEKKKVIAVVDAAISAGIYVIIDWHDHEAEKHVEAAKTFFAAMAQRYGDKPNVMYETYNEPLNVSWTKVLKPYHEAVIAEIRKYDPDNIVICGTRTWSQRVDEPAADPLADDNVAYALHFYASTHKQSLRDRAAQALTKGIALVVSEYGTTEASGTGFMNEAETKKWWAFMDQHKLSWCNWSLADKVENSAALKPGASTAGGWPDSQLTPSGIFVRTELRAKNPALK